MEKINVMKLVDKPDLELLKNKRIVAMKKIDWSKIMSITNQYIQKNLLKELLKNKKFNVYSTDDVLPEKIKTKLKSQLKNNTSGFDLIIEKNGKIFRIQSKLRQVDGLTDFSQKVHFETTRRNCIKNATKNHTGHVCYGCDEFDFVMITIINVKNNNVRRSDCNKWSFCVIPIEELTDKEHNCCASSISGKIIEKYLLNLRRETEIYKLFN